MQTGRCAAVAAKTVLNYLPRKSVVHQLTGSTKLIFFLLFTFAAMVTYDTRFLIGLLVVSFAIFRLSNIRLREVKSMMYFTLVFLLLNNLFIYLFNPDQGTTLYGTRHLLFHIAGRYDVTSEQLFYLLNISLKYFVSLPVAILFISATNPSEFAASLNSIGVSYRVGYSVALALRYIPDIQRDYHAISQAQQARGIELGRKEKLLNRLKNSVNILLPLILSSLQRIDVVSSAMELRGFGKDKKKRTWYMKRPMERNDYIAIALGVLLLLISIGMIALNGGSRFYNPFQ
jgi:energy-coupling factor transport system permease protein